MLPADKRLAKELACGITRHRDTLDWLIRRKSRLHKSSPVLTTLLRLGLYQMFWLDRVPDHAAVNETVRLARHLGCGPQCGYVNALLRGYAREREATRALLADLKINQPALGYSHPAWLAQRWLTRRGESWTRQLFEWNNTPPKIFARVNLLKATAPELLARWRHEGVEHQALQRDWLDDNLVFELLAFPPLEKLPSFQQGCFYVQDPSTLLAVRMLDPRPGENILDACAAPGGKTSYIAQRLGNQGRIMAQDLHPRRLWRLRENLDRLGVTCAAVSRPSGTPCPELNARYDAILLDAPCSNTGVLRRRVELRWRLSWREIMRLEAEQIALLRKMAAQIRPFGRLAYSTCSLEPEENTGVVQRFLREFPGWRLEQERELSPPADATDGAYVALLRAPAQPFDFARPTAPAIP